MRTTLTLDPDVAAKVRRVAAERGITFKAAVNAALRAGLEDGRGSGRPYREITRSLGVQPGVNLTKALHLSADIEDEATIRKLDLRK